MQPEVPRPGEPVVEVLAPEVLPDEVVRAEGDEADDGAQVQRQHARPRVLGEHAVEGGGDAEAALMKKKMPTNLKLNRPNEDFHLGERHDEVVEVADEGQSQGRSRRIIRRESEQR